MTQKYIIENGVLKVDPSYTAEQGKSVPATTVQDSARALAVVSSMQDVQDATLVQQQRTGAPMTLPTTTINSIQTIQSDDFLRRFQTPQPVNGGTLLDHLTAVFSRYEIPIGLIHKLLGLMNYQLHFIIDDSGSMASKTDVKAIDSTAYVQARCKSAGRSPHDFLTRWEEAEDRVHIMMDLIKFIPIQSVTFSFLNRSNRIVLSHAGHDPEGFGNYAHTEISKAFANGPNGGTPTYRCLDAAFNAATITPTLIYFFTDGVPSDRTTHDVAKLVQNRRNPQNCPLTFVTCTDKDSEAAWMKEIEEHAPLVAEMDDFHDERKEVYEDQGPAFPYTRGFWLICHLVGAINPDDLDAMDESRPFSKRTMDELMGRRLLPDEYRNYFYSNPKARPFHPLFGEFQREDVTARDIINRFGMPPQGLYQPQQTAHMVPMPQQAGYQSASQQPVYMPPQPVYGASAPQTMFAQQQPAYTSSTQPGAQPFYQGPPRR